MKYKSFVIKNYKGISSDTIIDLSKKSITPIIGVNESGKTTVLEALLSFDSYNDTTNGGNHLEDTENFYDPTNSKRAKIQANIELTNQELHAIIKQLLKVDEEGEYINEITEENLQEIEEYSEVKNESKGV